MSYQDHLKTCSYCSRNNPQKVKISVKSASSYRRERKLSELASVIKGTSYPGISYPSIMKTKITNVKGASNISNVEKSQKLKELGKMVRGL